MSVDAPDGMIPTKTLSKQESDLVGVLFDKSDEVTKLRRQLKQLQDQLDQAASILDKARYIVHRESSDPIFGSKFIYEEVCSDIDHFLKLPIKEG